MNGLFSSLGGGDGSNSPLEILKDSDNVLILIFIFMLMKEKANKPLLFALMSILMQGNQEPPNEGN